MRGGYNNKNNSTLTKSSSIFIKTYFDLLEYLICAEVITLYFPLNIITNKLLIYIYFFNLIS